MQPTRKNIASFVKVWATFFATVTMGIVIFFTLIVGSAEVLGIFLSGWLGDDYELKTDLMLVPAFAWLVLVFFIATNGTWRAGNIFRKLQSVSSYDVWAGFAGFLYALVLAVLFIYFGRNAGLDPAAGSALSMAGPITVFGCVWARLHIALNARARSA